MSWGDFWIGASVFVFVGAISSCGVMSKINQHELNKLKLTSGCKEKSP